MTGLPTSIQPSLTTKPATTQQQTGLTGLTGLTSLPGPQQTGLTSTITATQPQTTGLTSKVTAQGSGLTGLQQPTTTSQTATGAGGGAKKYTYKELEELVNSVRDVCGNVLKL